MSKMLTSLLLGGDLIRAGILIDITVCIEPLGLLSYLCVLYWVNRWHPWCQPLIDPIMDGSIGANSNHTLIEIWADESREMPRALSSPQRQGQREIHGVGRTRDEIRDTYGLVGIYGKDIRSSTLAWSAILGEIVDTVVMITTITFLQSCVNFVRSCSQRKLCPGISISDRFRYTANANPRLTRRDN